MRDNRLWVVVVAYRWDGSTVSIAMMRSLAISEKGKAKFLLLNVLSWASQNKSGRLTCKN